MAAFLQEGDHIVLQHGHELRRRPGQHDDDLARSRPHAAARRGADVVGEHGRALGQQDLLALVLPKGAALEIRLQTAQARLVDHKRSARHVGDGFLGQIVVGGPEAARGDDHVAPAERLLKRAPQPAGIVPHRTGEQQIDADGGKLTRDEGRVRVDRMPEQQLGSD